MKVTLKLVDRSRGLTSNSRVSTSKEKLNNFVVKSETLAETLLTIHIDSDRTVIPFRREIRTHTTGQRI